MPGPVCYGRGGTDPCVTDADVVLGILDPENFLGGDMKLDAEAAHKALARLGEKLGLDAEHTAWGVFDVVCEQMAAATRTHATDRGIDYRGLPLLAFGGAGPVHACMVAELVESSKVIYPPLASVLSAFGTLVTPAQIDLVKSLVARLDALDWDQIADTINSMVRDGSQALSEAGIEAGDMRFTFSAELRYLGQQSEVKVALDFDPRETRDADRIREIFEAEYTLQYGLKLDNMAIELVNWIVTASGKTPSRGTAARADEGAPPEPRSRTVYLKGEPNKVPVYQRADLRPGEIVHGPVIIEERETTAFVLPGWDLELNADGSMIATHVKGA